MLHSKKLLPFLVLAAAALCGCSQSDDEVAEKSGSEVAGPEVGVTFRLQSQGSLVTRSSEDSYNYVQGSLDEYKVNNARVYLFDNATKLFVKSFPLTNIKSGGNDPQGNAIYEADEVSVPQGIYDIFVTANTNRIIRKDNESAFLADIDSITYVRANITDISNGIVMSNRGSDNAQTTISIDNSGKPVTVYLERVLARLDVAKAAETFRLNDDYGVQYATIKLDGFHVLNLPKYYYTYRHTAILTSLAVPNWNLTTNFGNVADVNGYVVDPYFFKKKPEAANFTNSDKYYENFSGDLKDPNNVPWVAFNAPTGTGQPNYNTSYCLENCALAPAQMNGYSTGVFFKAIVEPSNNVYRLVNGNLELIADKNSYPEVIYYYNHKFYASVEALNAAAATDPSGTVTSRTFEKNDDGNYRCYYTYWIRHLDNFRPNLMGVMEFGIVRNNLYRMLVTGVTDLGRGGETELPPIVPDNPDEGEAYLKIELNVKPWIVRDLTNIVL